MFVCIHNYCNVSCGVDASKILPEAHCQVDKVINCDKMFNMGNTVEPLIEDPPRKGHCMFDLSIGDTVWGPKNYHSL